MQVDVSLALPYEAATVPLARHVVTAALLAAGVTAECVQEVEIAISEACTNVIVHSGGDSRYDVRINISDEQVNVDVVDTGTGFSAPAADSMDREPAEGGRGLALMTALTDRAVFDSVSGGGGSVHLVKMLRWTDDAPLHGRRARVHAHSTGRDGSTQT